MSLYQLNALRSPHLSNTRCVSLKIVKPVADTLSYEEKNDKLKREMSPHLTIYKPQLTSMLSITHRFTGNTIIKFMRVSYDYDPIVFRHLRNGPHWIRSRYRSWCIGFTA